MDETSPTLEIQNNGDYLPITARLILPDTEEHSWRMEQSEARTRHGLRTGLPKGALIQFYDRRGTRTELGGTCQDG